MALKAAAVLALLYLIGEKGLISISVFDTRKALTDWGNILPAFCIALIAQALCIIRWQWLLHDQGIRLPWRRTAQLVFIGTFFNVALPGAVSGDLVKAFYIGKEIPGKRARAFGAIIFDRVVGLSALILVSAASLFAGYQHFRGSPLISGIRVLVTFAALSVLVFYGYLFLVREHHDPLLRFLRALGGRHPRSGSLFRIYEGVRHYHNRRGTVVRVLLISIAIHLLVGCTCFLFARALGGAVPPLSAVYVVVPLGILVTAIPVAPAGVGTGHAAFYALFSLLGSERGADVYTLYALMIVLIGAFGGLVYLRFRSQGELAAQPRH